MNREAIHAALFAKLSGLAGVVTSSRKLKHWSDVPASQQPALFQSHKTESATTEGLGMPTKWTLYFDIYVYVSTASDPSASPSTPLNALLDAIELALKANPITNNQDLNGLVSHCWIAGSIETDEGTLGDQAVAIIPIEIFTT